MRPRILCVGIDLDLLTTRQAVLRYHGYDCMIATPADVDEKLRSGTFALVILSVMLRHEEKHIILAALPSGARPLVLESLVLPDQLQRLVAVALR